MKKNIYIYESLCYTQKLTQYFQLAILQKIKFIKSHAVGMRTTSWSKCETLDECMTCLNPIPIFMKRLKEIVSSRASNSITLFSTNRVISDSSHHGAKSALKQCRNCVFTTFWAYNAPHLPAPLPMLPIVEDLPFLGFPEPPSFCAQVAYFSLELVFGFSNHHHNQPGQ